MSASDDSDGIEWDTKKLISSVFQKPSVQSIYDVNKMVAANLPGIIQSINLAYCEVPAQTVSQAVACYGVRDGVKASRAAKKKQR